MSIIKQLNTRRICLNFSLSFPFSDSEVFFKKGLHRIGGQYLKAIYQEYTDDTFSVRKKRKPEEEHLGFLGPVIKASVGDLVKVQFYNKADRLYSIHPFGFFYDKFSEGSHYKDYVIHSKFFISHFSFSLS